MFRWVHSLFFLLLMAVGGVVRAQESFDTCLDLSSYNTPEGWTICYDDGTPFPVGNFYVGYVTNPYRTGVLKIDLPTTIITPNTVYVVTPDLGFDFSQNALIHFWIQGCESDIMEVGTLADTSDFSSFHVIDTIAFQNQNWREVAFESMGTPSGHTYIAFRLTHASSSIYSHFYIDDLGVTTQICWSSNYRVTMNETMDSAICSWDYFGDPNITLVVGDYTDNTWSSYLDVQGGSLTMPVVQGHRYIAYFYDTCNHTALYPCFFNNNIAVEFFAPYIDSSDCVDIGYLYSNKVTPYYGTYDNPYQNRGIVDLGSTNSASRHTINSDTSSRDPNVPSLRVIPEGENLSVRLGNWETNSQAEAMLYEIPVDTTRADMLILKYAAVLQDPDHDLTNQPRFRIEMLDSNMNLIAPVACNSYDFIASPALGWNSITGGILWKDWTTVGIDLSAYHGQTVRLRLTTYDCKMGAHYGYAYYTLSCARKSFFFRSCTVGDSNSVVAPDGFSYRWHRDDNPATIGTNNEITLPVDNHTYYCDLGFIGNPSCSVTMSVLSENVYPVAQIGYTVERDSCRFKVNFQNLSHLSYDSLHHCNNAEWFFHDGTQSTLENPVVYYNDTGDYPVILVSGFPADGCVDTTYDTIHLSLLFDTTMAAICENHSYLFCDSLFSTAGTYTLQPNCDSIKTLVLSIKDTFLFEPLATSCGPYLYHDSPLAESGDYEFIYSTEEDCDSIYRLHLTVNEMYDTVDTVFVCPGYRFEYRDVDYGGPRDFDAYLLSQHNCDSVVHVSLVVADPGFQAQAYYSFDNLHWTDSLPIKVCAPAQIYLSDSTLWAVGWRWRLPDSSIVAYPTATLALDGTQPSAFITLQVESLHGCFDTLLWPVVVFPSPEVDFGWDPAIPVDIAPTAQFFGFSEPDGSHDYRWFVQQEPGSSVFDTLEGREMTYTWQGDLPVGDFDVRMTASHEMYNDTMVHTCTDTAMHTVTIVTAYLQFPNLVTPNGDGVNDIWRVVNLLELGLYSMNELWIYNVWGTLVYHVENIRREDQFWDPNETHSPDGTYYYRFSAKGHHGLVRVNGSIEVAR
ncbi:MAG: gliding motility-associated C-terminal domain-containing protein [Bacteroidales bacterium]|nr:gliding motility-associated C-terminal domain-containing protein [Bacteroidales bacterium]